MKLIETIKSKTPVIVGTYEQAFQYGAAHKADEIRLEDEREEVIYHRMDGYLEKNTFWKNGKPKTCYIMENFSDEVCENYSEYDSNGKLRYYKEVTTFADNSPPETIEEYYDEEECLTDPYDISLIKTEG